MALHAHINIFREAGYTHDPIETNFVQPDYDQDVTYNLALSASPTGVNIPFGPITIAKLAYVETDVPVVITPHNGTGAMTVDPLLFLVGSAMTGMTVLAALTGANLKIYLAGE